MKVHFRTYCYHCRRAARWGRQRCHSHFHRYVWDYFIEREGVRLVQRQGFRCQADAHDSARRQWARLTEAGVSA